MALVLRPEARHWVAAIKMNGKLRRFPLTHLVDGVEVPIPIEGRRPSSLKTVDEGDRVFLNSYHTAMAAHDRLAQELKSRKTEVELTKRLIQARTGRDAKVVLVADLPSRWRNIPRTKMPGKEYLRHGSAVLGRFVEFMRTSAPDVVDVLDVTEDHLQAFLTKEDQRGISARSWNASLKFLRSVFSRVAPTSPGYVDYLRKLPPREENTVHRKPFKDGELEAILLAVQKDELLRGPVITAMCTGKQSKNVPL